MTDKPDSNKKEPAEGEVVKIEIDSHEEKEVFWHPEKLRKRSKTNGLSRSAKILALS